LQKQLDKKHVTSACCKNNLGSWYVYNCIKATSRCRGTYLASKLPCKQKNTKGLTLANRVTTWKGTQVSPELSFAV